MAAPGATATVFAPAKINLTLHVTGRRDDGYHLLDSLVVFADVGDTLEVRPADKTELSVIGPEAAGVPDGADNLVCRAADLFGHSSAFGLTKELPPSSGMGGGSADAGAALRGLAALAGHSDLPDLDALLTLGADVPVCVACAPARLRGVGESLSPVASLPDLHAVLINPRHALATPAVFDALETRENAPMPEDLPDFANAAGLIDWLEGQRNDLERPAVTLEPVIATILDELRGINTCRLARMSGSGATCFGLFDDKAAAGVAAGLLVQAHPDWWVRPAVLGNQADAARAQVS